MSRNKLFKSCSLRYNFKYLKIKRKFRSDLSNFCTIILEDHVVSEDISITTTATDADSANQFRIGAVSRITQIPVDTLRAWERRYNVVEPDRSTGAARLYSHDDVARLRLVKRLVDAGHAISSVASRNREELDELLALHEAHEPTQQTSIAALNSLLVYRDSDAHSMDLSSAQAHGIKVRYIQENWEALLTEIEQTHYDAIVIQAPTILADDALKIGRLASNLPSTRVIVSYGFAASANIERLMRDSVVAMRAPTNIEALLGLLQASPVPLDHDPNVYAVRPRRLFDDATLEELARISSTVQCECPHHLVDIVKTLNQFERYSAECESRSDKDAAIHAKLTDTAAAARSMFEKSLLEVAEHEGIELPAALRTKTEN